LSAPDSLTNGDPIVLSAALRDRLLTVVQARHPTKSFGYLVSGGDWSRPTDFVVFRGNVRNAEQWRPKFEAYGEYFVEHSDAGFVATPEESWRVERELAERGLEEVAVFHTHQRHPANFSRIDFELHVGRFPSLWHLIVSLRNPRYPQLRPFRVSRDGVDELPLVVVADDADPAAGTR
jgi:proteasome lid subunit RPN8/RPN11